MCRIIFHYFCFYYVEMRRKLWPKALAKEAAFGQMSKKFQVYFIHIHFFKKPNKKTYNRAKELYCGATIFVFWFIIVYLPKKKKWKLKYGPRLPALLHKHQCQSKNRRVRNWGRFNVRETKCEEREIFLPTIASKLREMKCETAFNLRKKFYWSGKRYLFTVMGNVVQFSPSIGNSVFNLFFEIFSQCIQEA